jgi:hypothetical protein
MEFPRIHRASALIAIFIAALVVRAGLPGFKIRQLGDEPKEQALTTMINSLNEGDVVAAGSPGVVWASRMTYLGLSSSDVPRERSADEFLLWMRGENNAAVYVDETLWRDNPAIWALIEPHIGDGLTVLYTDPDWTVQVLGMEIK